MEVSLVNLCVARPTKCTCRGPHRPRSSLSTVRFIHPIIFIWRGKNIGWKAWEKSKQRATGYGKNTSLRIRRDHFVHHHWPEWKFHRLWGPIEKREQNLETEATGHVSDCAFKGIVPHSIVATNGSLMVHSFSSHLHSAVSSKIIVYSQNCNSSRELNTNKMIGPQTG